MCSALRTEEKCADLRGADRQPSNADAVLLEHDEAALLERFGELREVRQQQRDDELSAMKGKAAQQHYGRPKMSPRRNQEAEIHVGRDQGALFKSGSSQNLLVERTLQAVLPYMHCIVPRVPKLFSLLCRSS